MTWNILEGDCTSRLRELDPQSVQTCITSPPYWGLRDYGTATWQGGDPDCEHMDSAFNAIPQNRDGRETPGGRGGTFPTTERQFRDLCGKCGATRIDSQLGLEPTPEDYVANLVSVFREVRRVLRDDGTLWLNLGDSYVSTSGILVPTVDVGKLRAGRGIPQQGVKPSGDMKPKDLVGIPWMVAFALRADGWYLRSDIVWAKPNPMPESVTDRPTKAHEYLFLLTKQPRYFYDADAIREGFADDRMGNPGDYAKTSAFARGVNNDRQDGGFIGNGGGWNQDGTAAGRNKRSVWTVSTQPYPGAHFATFPPKLIEPCVLAGSPPKCCGECAAPWERLTASEEVGKRERTRNVGGRTDGLTRPTGPGPGFYSERTTTGWKATCYHADAPAPDDTGRATVLDPFAGAGTTGLVALRHGRTFVGIELNPDYAELARNRIRAWEANPAGRLEGDPEPIPGQLGLMDG